MAFAAAVLSACCAAGRAETPLERGAYLVGSIMSCNNCHTPIGPQGPDFSKALSGGLTFDTPAFTVTAPNITPDKATGIGAWSDEELKRTLRTGVRPNGIPLAPMMPTAFYGIISDPDMDAIVAYLRSVRPISHAVPQPVYRVVTQARPFPGSERKLQDGGAGSQVEHGFYLATIGHCMDCHTPREEGRSDFNRIGAGGQPFTGPWGISVSRNITSDPELGLGRWSDDDIRRAITQGIAKDGSKLNPPMGFAYYARMTRPDLDAVVAWLRTLPPK